MKTIRRPNQYLQRQGEVWQYLRRVTFKVANRVGYEMISRSLETLICAKSRPLLVEYHFQIFRDDVAMNRSIYTRHRFHADVIKRAV